MLKCTKKRQAFVKRVIDNPGKGAEELEKIAKGLRNCKNVYDTIFALSEILFLSERTIRNDLSGKHYHKDIKI
jgi:hypothetical protein